MLIFLTKFKLFLSNFNHLFNIKFVFLLAIPVLVFLFWSFNSISIDIGIQFYKNFNAFKLNETLEKPADDIYITIIPNKRSCNPILTNSQQYSVLIDGVKYPTKVPLHKNVSINFECLDQNSTKKIILIYNKYFKQDEWQGIPYGYRHPFIRAGCPVTNCEIMNDKNRLNESDFVITHMVDDIPQLPSFRPANQRWIFFTHVVKFYLKKFRIF